MTTHPSILITGGTGSLGKALVRRLMDAKCARRVIVFSRDELKQHEMQQVWPAGVDSPIRYFIGDVRDRARLDLALRDVQIVIHAAALKQVPTCERDPREAILTNVMGTLNVIEASIDAEVEKVMLISTDKCCSPCTLYGATKLAAERLVAASNAYVRNHKTKLSAVRYGNVFGSRGSVVHLFREQMKRGEPCTITDPQATRFWITMEQAVEFVLSSIELMKGGEVFIPKLGKSTIDELAHALAASAGWGWIRPTTVGLRGMEKRHEALISRDEVVASWDLGDRYVIAGDWSLPLSQRPAFEEYSSQTARTLSEAELRQMVEAL